MSELPLFLTYKKGDFEDLDKKWEKYRKMQIFTGHAYRKALTKREVDDLVEVWKTKRLKPKTMTFREISTYVKLAEKISDYRYRVKVERTRLRVARSRDKLIDAVRKGDSSAIKRYDAIKKCNSDNMSQKRKAKRNGPSSN